MAAKDGVISANERRLLKEFADEYGIDASYLYRLAYAQVNECEQDVELISSNEIKGRRFEEFVVSLLDNKKRYKLLAWRSDKISGNVYAAENLYPDLHISHIINDREEEYYIECKYRSSWGDGKIDLSSQFMRYYFCKRFRQRAVHSIRSGRYSIVARRILNHSCPNDRLFKMHQPASF